MPVRTSYPGVYIQELPSLVHTITPAPTSIAVFVGYTHPFRTLKPETAIQLFSFADYQANFGGFFFSPWQPDYVGQAVYQFFLNGGATCYVVGLKAKQYSYTDRSGSKPVEKQWGVIQASNSIAGFTFTALQPVGRPKDPNAPETEMVGIPMKVAISNLQKTTESNDTADIVISYGTTVETYRKVQIDDLVTRLQGSSLVTVVPEKEPEAAEPEKKKVYPSDGSPFSVGYGNDPPPLPPDGTVLDRSAFAGVFADYQSLDKVPVFNLLATPGITDDTVVSEAVAYCERKRAFYIMDTPSPRTTGWDVNKIVQDSQALSADSPRSASTPRSTIRGSSRPTRSPGTRSRPRRAGSWPVSTARWTPRRGSGSPRRASRRPSSAPRASTRPGS